jgi:lipocalin-like protein
MTRVISVVLFILIFSVGPIAAQEVLEGTWKLVSSTRTNTTTGATTDSFGPNPLGYIMYGKDGRMMVLITRSDRPKPDSTDKMTDEQRSRLFSSMLAYSGTYKFDGETIEHHIDGSWNQVWTGTTQIRNVKKDGDRLIYTTQPGPSPIDGSMGFATLVWEKVK